MYLTEFKRGLLIVGTVAVLSTLLYLIFAQKSAADKLFFYSPAVMSNVTDHLAEYRKRPRTNKTETTTGFTATTTPAANEIIGKRPSINKTQSVTSSLIQAANERLGESLMNICSKLSRAQQLPDLMRMFVIEQPRRVVYCASPKSASTSWRRVLLNLTGKNKAEQLAEKGRKVLNKNVRRYVPTSLSAASVRQLKSKLKDYYKFTFVRDPLERLVSAYRDKIIRDPGFERRRERIISWRSRNKAQSTSRSEKLRSDAFNSDAAVDKNISFSEFVDYVVDAYKNEQKLNIHWRPQNWLCRPCSINYDFVGHYETLEADARQVLKAISAPPDVQFPHTDPDNQHKKTSEYVEKLFETVPTENIVQLLRLYSLDYTLFGYKIPPFLRGRIAEKEN